MTSILLAIVIIGLLAALLMYGFKPYDYGGSIKRFKKIGRTGDTPTTSSDTRWRSVKIRPGLMSCKPVAAISSQIFLSRDAPSLPLQDCTEEDCRCHYIFLEDRRSGGERRIEIGQLEELLPDYSSERRQLTGRRLTDQAA